MIFQKVNPHLRGVAASPGAETVLRIYLFLNNYVNGVPRVSVRDAAQSLLSDRDGFCAAPDCVNEVT